MPLYNYLCLDCRDRAEQIKGSELSEQELPEVLFETRHTMNPQPEELLAARECPRCQGVNTEKSLVGVELTCYVRGYGYLDRQGCHRDMNLYKLEQDDPYKGMRVPGEEAELKCKLQRAGRHDPKPKHYIPPVDTASMERAVTAAVKSE